MFPFIVLFLSLVGAQVVIAQQLTCRAQDTQLAISPNAMGTYDVTFTRVVGGQELKLKYLAIMLDCQVSDQEYECHGTKSDSPHVASKLQARVTGNKDDRRYTIKITSPLIADGSADYDFPLRDCEEQLRFPTKGHDNRMSCMAFFSGALYDPDKGYCVTRSASGCRNPFPWHDIKECRAALSL